MAYNSKALLLDSGSKPIPQFYDEVRDSFFPMGHIYDVVLQDGATATGDGTPLSVGNIKTITIEISGTATGQTIVFEGQGVSGTYYAIQGTRLNDLSFGSQSTSLNELWQFDITGLISFQARISNISNGSVTVKGKGVAL